MLSVKVVFVQVLPYRPVRPRTWWGFDAHHRTLLMTGTFSRLALTPGYRIRSLSDFASRFASLWLNVTRFTGALPSPIARHKALRASPSSVASSADHCTLHP